MAEFSSFPGPPSFLSIQGKIYHHLCPNHPNSAVHWLLFDCFDLAIIPHLDLARSLPTAWITAMQQALLLINPLTQPLLYMSHLLPSICANTQLELFDTGTSEMAAVMTYQNMALTDFHSHHFVVVQNDTNSH